MKRILVPLLVLALILASVPAFAEGNTIKFDNKVNSVFEGESVQTILVRTGVPAEGELTYETANAKIATVDSNGVVTGVSKGRVTIAAVSKTESRTFKAQLTVNVLRKAETVEVDTQKLAVFTADDPKVAGLLKPEGEAEEKAETDTEADPDAELPVLMLPVKKQLNLRISVLPKDASNRRVVLSTGDETIALARGGSVTGKAAGVTILTVANELSPEINTRFKLLVVQPVTRINVTPAKPAVAAGSKITLTASVLPENASMQQIEWSSADERIATVDENGVVTGIKRGNVRIIAAATDGSNIRANISVRVTQAAEEINLKETALTVDVGRNGMLRAEVLPKNTDDKSLVWTSSDESVATVNKQGRVTGVSLGTCQITCSSAATEGVSATATVTVQQPVTKIVFGEAPTIYADETGKLTWTVEPANASNPTLTFASNNPKVLTVSEDGIITGIKRGEATIIAKTTDGSNRQARIKVKVHVHATGVHMRRKTAYINTGESATCTAVLEPKEADDTRMTWSSDDPGIATATGQNNRVKITGKSEGITTVTGILADGGHETSIEVHVGSWDKSIRLTQIDVDGRGNLYFTARNVSELDITMITCEAEYYTSYGDPIAVNTKDGSNKVTITYKRALAPGARTREDYWKFQDFEKPQQGFGKVVLKVVSFQIDNDWIKDIRESRRPSIEWNLLDRR